MARYNKSHGLRNTKLYNIWNSMLGRCNRPSQDSYRIYGAKGIKVCKEWHNFVNFYADMGNSYKDGLSLDRIDNSKGYYKENCRWVTVKEQARNTSRTRWITIDGVTKNLSAWIEDSGLKSSTVRQRYYVLKWDIKRSLGIGG